MITHTKLFPVIYIPNLYVRNSSNSASGLGLNSRSETKGNIILTLRIYDVQNIGLLKYKNFNVSYGKNMSQSNAIDNKRTTKSGHD